MRRLLTLLPCVLFAAGAEAISVVTVGDSIVQTYAPDSAIWGWGQTLPSDLPGLIWTNLAVSGESSKSFIDEGLWSAAVAQRANWLLLEFGHNDSHYGDAAHYTNPNTTFKDNLRLMADQARAVGTEPIFVTPAARRGGLINDDTLPSYAASMIAVGQERGVATIDLHGLTLHLYAELGSSAQAILGPNDWDVTHFGHYGAQEVGFLLASSLPAGFPASLLSVPASQSLYAFTPTARQFTVDGTLRIDGLSLGINEAFLVTGTGTTILTGTQSYADGATLQFGSQGTSPPPGVPEPPVSLLLLAALLVLALRYARQRACDVHKPEADHAQGRLNDAPYSLCSCRCRPAAFRP